MLFQAVTSIICMDQPLMKIVLKYAPECQDYEILPLRGTQFNLQSLS